MDGVCGWDGVGCGRVGCMRGGFGIAVRSPSTWVTGPWGALDCASCVRACVRACARVVRACVSCVRVVRACRACGGGRDRSPSTLATKLSKRIEMLRLRSTCPPRARAHARAHSDTDTATDADTETRAHAHTHTTHTRFAGCRPHGRGRRALGSGRSRPRVTGGGGYPPRGPGAGPGASRVGDVLTAPPLPGGPQPARAGVRPGNAARRRARKNTHSRARTHRRQACARERSRRGPFRASTRTRRRWGSGTASGVGAGLSGSGCRGSAAPLPRLRR